MTDLNAIEVKPKTGNEPFSLDNQDLDFNLNDFWSWSMSDFLTNTIRGVLAEYIVRMDLGISNPVRVEWDAYDLETENGKKIEIKSASYLQSWGQNKLSQISFDIAPKKGWNAMTNEYSTTPSRQADYYVFCLLHHDDKATVDPIKLEQWSFYVLATEILDKQKCSQKKIGLNSLLALNPIKCRYGEICKAIS